MDTFVLIVGQYKGGSTLLMRVLNNFPHVQIAGENGGAFNYITSFYEKMKFTNSIKHTQDDVDMITTKPSWLNEFNLMKIKTDLKKLCFNIYKSHDITHFGFKEISYGSSCNYETMEEHLNILKEIIPELKIVFLTRKRNFTENQHDIDYLNNDRKSTTEEYENQFSYFHKYHNDNNGHTYILDYSNLAQTPASSEVINMFNFLGIEYYSQFFKEVMQIRL